MEATFEYIKLNEELGQSAYFGRLYKELFETPQGSAFTSPLIENISELLNNILLKYDGLTQFQKDILKNIFNEFNKIRIIIDPQRLKSFKHYLQQQSFYARLPEAKVLWTLWAVLYLAKLAVP